MKNKEIEELLNMLKKCAREDKATLKLNEIACKTILSYIEQLEKRNKELYEGFMATQEELTDYATKNEQLENNRDKAIELLYKRKHVENLLGGVEKSNTDKIIDILKGDSDE